MNRSSEDASTGGWSARELRGNPHEMRDKPERIRHMFAAIARRYDLNNRLHSFGRDMAWRKAAVRAASPSSSDDVLDVACGTGDLSLAFAMAGAKSVTGVDFTDEMLEIARRKADDRDTTKAVEFLTGDAMQLPFDDSSFDIASIAFGIRNVADPDRALQEFRRVLRPEGRLVVLEFSRPRNPLIRFGNHVYTTRIMPWTATLLSGDRTGAYRYLPRSVETFAEGEAMLDKLRAAGFVDVSQWKLTFGVCSIYCGVVRECDA